MTEWSSGPADREAELKSAKLIIEVTAGLIPGQPEDEFTRRWGITSDDWEAALAEDEALRARGDEQHAMSAALMLAFRAAEADEYARLLRNPSRFNFVRTEWIWL